MITDTATIVRRLRDGAPCADSEGYPCVSRETRAGCDCTIAADKIESDAKVIAALRELTATAKKIVDAGQRAEDMHPIGSHAHDLVLGTTLTSHWTLTKMVLTELIAAVHEQTVGENT